MSTHQLGAARDVLAPLVPFPPSLAKGIITVAEPVKWMEKSNQQLQHAKG
jgi:hypothetical protein